MAAAPELINTLIRLGFSQYEAQAYIALVGQGALTGAEVSRGAGVPPSKIYETLGRLESKGAVLVNRSEPVRYSAVPHADLLAVARSRFEADVFAAKEKLDHLPVQEELGLVWSLRSRQTIVQAFARVTAGAERHIFAGIWDEEMDEIGPLLEQAAERGVDTQVAIYGKRTLVGPHTYDLSECGASARLRLSGRRLAVVVADDSQTVVAEFGDRTPDQAVLTTNPVTILLAVEYIKADVSGRLLINTMSASEYRRVLATPDMRAILSPAVSQVDEA
ncbi:MULTISPECIES: TrmB family transcriptional regulator [unclassified Bradyrhizobium]|uniref:TrmB family transcriptional regulator n=1 Tax=unclassified Bradyrhizobium TaxID=2631580 RepID=UPI0028F09063|nr:MULTISPECIES: helix-turn-helix domain-containing protein [unclassified Bradyrhizobium]